MNLNEEFKNGVDALKKHKYVEAEKIFKNLIKKQPMNAEFNHLMGITFQLLNKIDEAVISFKKTIEIKPDFAEAQKNLGNMFYRLGKIDEAEMCYKKAIDLKSDFIEVIDNLNVVKEQKKVLLKVKKNRIYNKKNNSIHKIGLTNNPFIFKRQVEPELIKSMYQISSIELDKTQDIRYGKGKCSPDLKLFENNLPIIKNLEKDLIITMEESVGSKILIVESFFNILSTGSGTSPHRHLDPFDKANGLDKQKYSLVYYLTTGNQNCTEPGILKLYDPEEEILPSEGLIVIFPAGRKHSSSYNGREDRIMIGVNFYSLN